MADTVALILWGDGNTGNSDYIDIGQTEKSQALRDSFLKHKADQQFRLIIYIFEVVTAPILKL